MSHPQPTLPRAVDRALRGVKRRLRAGAVLRGLGVVGLAASLGAAGAMAVDFAGDLSSAIRWGMWAAWAAAVGGLAVSKVVRPLVRRVGPFELASIAERSDARLGGSLA